MIIKFSATFTEAMALEYAKKVIEQGRVSVTGGKEHYCHVTKFADNTVVYAGITRNNTDTFQIWKEGNIK